MAANYQKCGLQISNASYLETIQLTLLM